MVRAWYERVEADDLILHLGDLAYRGGSRCVPPLPGVKLLLPGNHDTKSVSWYRDCGFQVLHEPISVYESRAGLLRYRHGLLWTAPDERLVLLSHWPDRDLVWDVNVHGHIHNNGWPPDLPNRDYRNVSVEVTGFAPVRLRDALRGAAGECRAASSIEGIRE